MKFGVLAALMVVGLITLGRGPEAPRAVVPILTAKSTGVTSGSPLQPLYAAIDSHPATGTVSNANGVLEPGETVQVSPYWTQRSGSSLDLTRNGVRPDGPGGARVHDRGRDGRLRNDRRRSDERLLRRDRRLLPHDRLGRAARGALGRHVRRDAQRRRDPRRPGPSTSARASPTFRRRIPFYAYIENLFHNGHHERLRRAATTVPTSSVTRAQMAVFLLKTEHGASIHAAGLLPGRLRRRPVSVASSPTGSSSSSAEGITGGCGGGDYCPDNPVTRAQMAVFLLKAEHGSSLRAARPAPASSGTCRARASSPTGSSSSSTRASPAAAAAATIVPTTPSSAARWRSSSSRRSGRRRRPSPRRHRRPSRPRRPTRSRRA